MGRYTRLFITVSSVAIFVIQFVFVVLVNNKILFWPSKQALSTTIHPHSLLHHPESISSSENIGTVAGFKHPLHKSKQSSQASGKITQAITDSQYRKHKTSQPDLKPDHVPSAYVASHSEQTKAKPTPKLADVLPVYKTNHPERKDVKQTTQNGNVSSIYIADYYEKKNATGSSQLSKLVFYYNIPKWIDSKYFQSCPNAVCTLSTDFRMYRRADAVLFHACRLLPDELPPPRPLGQVWIAFCLEAPKGYWPGYTSDSWRDVFNWTMTYRTDSDIFNPYRLLKYKPLLPDKNYTAIALNKSKDVAWFVSNCSPTSQRMKYVTELRKHINVDIFGRCGDYKCPKSDEKKCLKLLSTSYRFYLAFENSFCKDYVSEKFFKVFTGIDTIPVVRGGADYERYFPKETFINTADFETPKDLALKLKQVGSNLDSYARMLREKDHYELEYSLRNPACDLCEKLHGENTRRTYSDFPQWVTNGTCWEPTDI